MIRLRVTDLDQWVRYVEPEREEFEVSTESFIAGLRRENPPTDDMLCGSAFHTLLEKAAEGDYLDGVEVDGFAFTFGGTFEVQVPAERETLIEKVYPTSAGPVLLRGKFDARDAGTVTDYKLTCSTFDAERYAGSLQWRAYLDMLGDRRFRYAVFQAKRTDRDVWIHDLHSLTFWSYPEMHAAVQRRVEELARFVAVHVPELVTDGVPA